MFLFPCIATQPARAANQGGAEDDDNINVDGRRDDGTLVFNSTTEFSTRLQAHLNERARAKTEALMRGLERDSSAAAPASGSKRPHMQQDMMAVDEDDDSDGGSQERKTGGKKTDAADISGTMEDFAGMSDMDDSDMEVDEDDEDGDEQGGEVGDEQLDFVHRQPLVGKGMAATLALLKGSGELKKVEQLAGRAKDSRQYDPSSTDHGIKLEYRDEFGRKLTQKEAFRQLSYKFHGYGPSQKKKEKRLKVSADQCIWAVSRAAKKFFHVVCFYVRHITTLFDNRYLLFDAAQALEVQNKAQSSRAGILEGVGGTMKSLTQAQEATGRAHITIQVRKRLFCSRSVFCITSTHPQCKLPLAVYNPRGVALMYGWICISSRGSYCALRLHLRVEQLHRACRRCKWRR
jgi:hypothetical protein